MGRKGKSAREGWCNARWLLLLLPLIPLLVFFCRVTLRDDRAIQSIAGSADSGLDVAAAMDQQVVLPPHPPVDLPTRPAPQTMTAPVNSKPSSVPEAPAEFAGQAVHWIFVTDCSAYMFNQGNLMLSSAYEVNQPGEWTWIAYGCRTQRQVDAMQKVGHPRAKVWHAPEVGLTNPATGKPYKAFQASNRPVSIFNWWKAVQPKEEAIAILDPDMFWLRPVHLVERPKQSNKDSASARGPWFIEAAKPGKGTGAMYGIGCVPTRWDDKKVGQICGSRAEECLRYKREPGRCASLYSSGPPWILHRDDAEKVFAAWMDQAITVHDVWPDMLAEQASYGITQMTMGVENQLDAFWFLSNTQGTDQPWGSVVDDAWDPCAARAPPPLDSPFPPLWHACSTYDIKAVSGFRIHKDHIQKDLLDCTAPLIHYPPKDALERLDGQTQTREYRQVWAVCTYTNVLNAYATSWKRRYCENPNLAPTFKYPPHSQGFINKSSWLESVFRKGGWSDIDYKVSGH